jgi:hypothetical protein
MREQTAEHDRLKGRYALQFKRGYNEKMGGGRWKWGDRFGSFGTTIFVCDRSTHRRATTSGKREIGRAWKKVATSLHIFGECTTTNASK